MCHFFSFSVGLETRRMKHSSYFFYKSHLLEQILGPHNAMDWLRGRVSDCAAWECFLSWFRLTFITFCHSLVKNEVFICHSKKATDSLGY